MKNITTFCVTVTAIGAVVFGALYNAGEDSSAAWTGLLLSLMWMLHSAWMGCKLEKAQENICRLYKDINLEKKKAVKKSCFVNLDGKRTAEGRLLDSVKKICSDVCNEVVNDIFAERERAQMQKEMGAMRAGFFKEV